MCEPISVGIATAAAGGAKSIADFRRGQYENDLQNQRLDSQYQYDSLIAAQQNRFIDQEYAFKEGIYQEDLKNNRDAYNLGTYKNNLAYREQVDEAAFTNLGMNQQLNQQVGRLAAKGIEGRSAQLADNSLYAQFGMNESMIANNLMRARFATNLANEDIRLQTISANNQARARLGIKRPYAIGPSKPIYGQGPSGLGLAANLGSNILGGISSGLNFASTLKGLE